MSKVTLGILGLCIASLGMADKLYCNAGVTLYYSDYSASMEQSNGTKANFEFYSMFKTKSGEDLIGYRATDIPGFLAIPKIINRAVKVTLELDGDLIPFTCHR